MLGPKEVRLLSVTVSFALRHAPEKFDLELDEEGWGDVPQLIQALRKIRPEWANISSDDLADMISRSTKDRHEMKGERIRALYGHTVAIKVDEFHGQVPERLYHGTDKRASARILKEGLLPMGRRFVHMTTDQAYAISARRRKIGKPILVLIDSAQAAGEGIAFHRANEHVWLAESIPARFLSHEIVSSRGNNGHPQQRCDEFLELSQPVWNSALRRDLSRCTSALEANVGPGDGRGWVKIDDVLDRLHVRRPCWRSLTKAHVLRFIIWKNAGCYELRGDTMRALPRTMPQPVPASHNRAGNPPP